jgi:hypothetical protein
MLVAARHAHVFKLLGNVFEPRHIDRSSVTRLARVGEPKNAARALVDLRDGRGNE